MRLISIASVGLALLCCNIAHAATPAFLHDEFASSANRNVYTQTHYGVTLLYGDDLYAQNVKYGLELLGAAAKREHPPALVELAKWYAEHSPQRNEKLAYSYLTRAVASGYPDASFYLAYLLESDKFITQESKPGSQERSKRILHLYSAAKELEHPGATYGLDLRHLDGSNSYIGSNPESGMKYLRASANAGYAPAHLELARRAIEAARTAEPERNLVLAIEHYTAALRSPGRNSIDVLDIRNNIAAAYEHFDYATRSMGGTDGMAALAAYQHAELVNDPNMDADAQRMAGLRILRIFADSNDQRSSEYATAKLRDFAEKDDIHAMCFMYHATRVGTITTAVDKEAASQWQDRILLTLCKDEGLASDCWTDPQYMPRIKDSVDKHCSALFIPRLK